jgi:two-component system sensor kinase FixL
MSADAGNSNEPAVDTPGSVARIAAILATATEGIVTIDQNGVIDTFNAAAERLFGYRADEVIGRNVSILCAPPHRDHHDEYIERYLRTGEARVIGIGREVLGQRKDGSVFPIDLSIGEGIAGGQRFFTAIFRDVTERKTMQAKLALTERLAAVGELAAGVAHEINNPINTIINCAQLIKDGDEPGANCDVILAEGERIAEIVRDLLRFARDDRDRPESTSWSEVIERTLRLVGESMKRHGIELSVEVPGDLPPVMARAQRLQQVLLNLLINAKDALLHHDVIVRRVEVTATVVGRNVELRVADNGPGIPVELGRRIFEPFVTTKRAHGGTGLGLSVSKSIIEDYEGTIDVASIPGHGAEFRVQLPRASAAPA